MKYANNIWLANYSLHVRSLLCCQQHQACYC